MALHPKQRILVVEDDKTSSLVLVRMLKKAGFACDTAFNGEEAISKLLISKGDTKCLNTEYLCVLLDLNMPIMDGANQPTDSHRRGEELPQGVLPRHGPDGRSRQRRVGKPC